MLTNIVYSTDMSSLPQSAPFLSSPSGVILLRIFAFLICAFLLTTKLWDLPETPVSTSESPTLSGGVVPPKPKPHNESTTNGSAGGEMHVWQSLLELLPGEAVENAKLVWRYGAENQLGIVSLGLLTCLTAIFLAGPAR